MLEAFSTFFRRGVDPLFLRGGELSGELVLREEFDNSLTQTLGGEGPYWRSFSFDLEGGMVDGLLWHRYVSCYYIVRGG